MHSFGNLPELQFNAKYVTSSRFDFNQKNSHKSKFYIFSADFPVMLQLANSAKKWQQQEPDSASAAVVTSTVSNRLSLRRVDKDFENSSLWKPETLVKNRDFEKPRI